MVAKTSAITIAVARSFHCGFAVCFDNVDTTLWWWNNLINLLFLHSHHISVKQVVLAANFVSVNKALRHQRLWKRKNRTIDWITIVLFSWKMLPLLANDSSQLHKIIRGACIAFLLHHHLSIAIQVRINQTGHTSNAQICQWQIYKKEI
jgi:hypothetical protein